MTNYKLRVQPVPFNKRNDDIKRMVPQWSVLKRAITDAAANTCNMCGARLNGGVYRPDVMCVWEYDTHTQEQRLINIVCACEMCLITNDWISAIASHRGAQAKEHFKRVNDCNDDAADAHISQAMRNWSARNSIMWSYNLSWINTHFEGTAWV